MQALVCLLRPSKGVDNRRASFLERFVKLVRARASDGLFKVLACSRSLQAARMTLKLGQSTGALHNEHPASEQWLLVISGRGVARVSTRRLALRKNDLLLIEKREMHQITQAGRRPLVTLSFYAPPAYTKDGDVKPSRRPSHTRRRGQHRRRKTRI